MRGKLEPLFAVAFFPLVFSGALGGALVALERGVDPLVALLGAQLPAFAAVIAAERVFPLHPSWNRSQGDLRTDIVHLAVTALGVTRLVELLAVTGAALVAIRLAGAGDLGWWPQGWPLLAQLLLAMVAGELLEYWVHRLQHTTDCLWRFHAVHHSAPRLYWLNAARFHPVDLLLNGVASSGLLVLLGAGPGVIALRALFSALHGIFQHSNLVLRLGPLNWLFSMAELHRWHHSRSLAEANHNYGQNLIVWDVVFGTRFLPADREPPERIGIGALPGFPAGYLAQLAAPFRWARVQRESLAPAPRVG